MPASSSIKTAQQVALAGLREDILLRRIVPGQVIRADQIGERLGVSRIPVREALKVLEGEGQVVYRPQHGYRLATLSADDLHQIYVVRDLLEDDAARRSVPAVRAEHIDRMREADADITSADPYDLVALAAANRRFHFSLFEATEMRHLLRHIDLLWRSTDAYRSLYFDPGNFGDEARHEHEAILEAVEARDVEQTVSLLATHRANSLRGLLLVLNEGDGDAGSA